MTRKELIRMAREAGWEYADDDRGFEPLWYFAALVAEYVRYDGIHSCHSECQRPACVAMREAVLAEREACAKVCDDKVDAEYATGKVDHNEMGWTQACAAAIRARGQE
jgi:hypothetical protein